MATATAAALMGMECEIFMGKEDTERQALNVYRMRLLGAKVNAVTSGTATLKDAVSETMREWTNRISDTHYILGSVMGPHPFPTIVRDFQAVISKEIKEQILEKEGRLPDAVLACVGGGSNAIGTFYNFKYGIDIMEQMGIPVQKIHAGKANMFLSPLFRDTAGRYRRSRRCSAGCFCGVVEAERFSRHRRAPPSHGLFLHW